MAQSTFGKPIVYLMSLFISIFLIFLVLLCWVLHLGIAELQLKACSFSEPLAFANSGRAEIFLMAAAGERPAAPAVGRTMKKIHSACIPLKCQHKLKQEPVISRDLPTDMACQDRVRQASFHSPNSMVVMGIKDIGFISGAKQQLGLGFSLFHNEKGCLLLRGRVYMRC